jgi:hypothetical protein
MKSSRQAATSKPRVLPPTAASFDKEPKMRIGDSISCLLLGSLLSVGALAGAAEKSYEAVDYQRRTIYHSPQTPGYTCWVHAWTMSDGSVMFSFCQATGPKEGRPRAPDNVIRQLWDITSPGRDMTGLDQSIVCLRSKDGGATWNKESEYAFRSPANIGLTGSTGLRDGTILRAWFGGALAYDPGVPATGVWHRSTDGAKTWNKLAPLLPPDNFTVYTAMIHQLRDGRVMLTGGVSRVPTGRTFEEWYSPMEPLLLISSDGGKTWGKPIQVIPEKYRKGWTCEECDAVELPDGDLFWVFRRSMPEDADKPVDKRRHTYWQGVTEKQGDTWTPKWVGPSPFPNIGLPSLVATREGPIVLVNAGQWTDDLGHSWHPIINLPANAGAARYASSYYPKGVQLADGRILVIAHAGTDDPYGVDQSIVMDSFRLKAK